MQILSQKQDQKISVSQGSTILQQSKISTEGGSPYKELEVNPGLSYVPPSVL